MISCLTDYSCSFNYASYSVFAQFSSGYKVDMKWVTVFLLVQQQQLRVNNNNQALVFSFFRL